MVWFFLNLVKTEKISAIASNNAVNDRLRLDSLTLRFSLSLPQR